MLSLSLLVGFHNLFYHSFNFIVDSNCTLNKFMYVFRNKLRDISDKIILLSMSCHASQYFPGNSGTIKIVFVSVACAARGYVSGLFLHI